MVGDGIPPSAAFIAGSASVGSQAPAEISLEELVHEAVAQALDEAATSRAQVDSVYLSASDQMDGHAISSMLLAGPAGAHLKDEIKVTDDGLLALLMACIGIEAGISDVSLAVSWTRLATGDLLTPIGVNADPVFERPVGLHPIASEAMAIRRFLRESELDASLVDDLALRASDGRTPLSDAIVSSPLRTSHVPPATNGAVAVVVTREPSDLAVSDYGWAVDHSNPLHRLHSLGSLPDLAERVLDRVGIHPDGDLTVETTDRNVFRLLMSACGLGFGAPTDTVTALLSGELPRVNESGGLWASNPVQAAGLERVVALSRTMRENRRTHGVAHSTYGCAGQGNAVVVIRYGG